MPSLPSALRVPVIVTVAVTVVAGAYGLGLATGMAASHHRRASTAGTNLDAIRDRLSSQAADKVSTDKLDRAAVKAMIGALDDPWSAYFDGQGYARYQASLDGEYSGVGLLLRQRSDGTVYVAAVEVGSPAAKAGVPRGGVIVAVDGKATSGRSVGDVAGELRGASGTPVTVTLVHRKRTLVLRLVRADLVSPDVTVDWLSPQIARVTITDFTRGVGHRVRDAVAAIDGTGAVGIVLDLRGNPGGLLDEAVEAASAFLDGGPVVSYQRRGQPAQVLDAEHGGDTTTPLAVLVDGGTASAAEVLAAALQDRSRAVVIGTRTFGKGTVQQPVHLPDGSVADMTVAHYRTPAGRSLDGVGLEPDIEVAPGSPPSVAQQRAVQVLSGLLADAGTGGRG